MAFGGEKIAEMFVEIRAEQDRLRKDFDKVKRDSEKAGKEAGNRFGSSFSKGFSSLTAKIGGVIAAVMAFREAFDLTIQAKNLARDADEIASKFDVVFGELAEQSRAWAREFGAAVGRANQDVEKWLSTLQDTFVPLGFGRKEAAELSKTLTRLAVDVASFSNAADTDVLNNFTSALVGNHEAVRSYGIVITENSLKQEALRQGLQKNFSQLTELEKVQLRYNLIMRSTADAQGDAIRTASSLANLEKQRDAALTNLLETLGKKAQPIFTGFVRLQIDLFKALSSQPDAIDEVRRKATEQKTTFQQLVFQYNNLRNTVNRTDEENKLYQETISRLQSLYPNYLKNVDLERGSREDVSAAFADASKKLNAYIEDSIRLAIIEQKQAQLIQLGTKIYELRQKQLEKQKQAFDELAKSVTRSGKAGEIVADMSGKIQRDTEELAPETAAAWIDVFLAQLEAEKGRLTSEIESISKELTQALAPRTTPETGKPGQPQQPGKVESPDFKDAKNAYAKFYEAVGFDAAGFLAYRKELIRQEIEATRKAIDEMIMQREKLSAAEADALGLPSLASLQAIDLKQLENKRLKELDDDYQAYLKRGLIDNADAYQEYYDRVGFAAKGYLEYRKELIGNEVERLQAAIGEEVDLTLYKNARLRELEEEHTEFLDGQNKKRLESVHNFVDPMVDAFISAFDMIRFKTSETDSILERAFINMANAFISQVQRMIAAWLQLQILKGIGGLLGIPVPGGSEGGVFVGTPGGVKPEQGHEGGVFVAGMDGLKKMQAGGSFIVPQGFPNDTYPLMVESGERVTVDTAATVREQNKLINQLSGRIAALSMNMATQRQQQEITLRAILQGSLLGRDIQLSYDKAKRIEKRLR